MPYITEKDMLLLAPVACGEVSSTNAAATQFPAIQCSYILIKALAANTGNIHIGLSGVTIADGATDVTTGYELDAGDELIVPLKNGNTEILYHINTAANGGFTYLCLG